MGKSGIAVIAGAGPAGLTAAWFLLKTTDMTPVILEAEEQVGGISRTVEYRGNRMDLGGHRFFSKIPEVNALWREILPDQTAPARDGMGPGPAVEAASGASDPELEDGVMLIRRRVSRIFYLNRFFDYPISLSLRTFLNLGPVRTVAAGAGYLLACLRKRPENSLEDFYINRFGAPLYRMFFEDYTEKLWGVHPSRITPEWGAQRVKGLSLARTLWHMFRRAFRGSPGRVETSLIDSFRYPKLGTGQFWELLARRVIGAGGRLELNARVTGVEMENGRVVAVRFERSGQSRSIGCDAFFSSMPIRDLITALPSVPESVRGIAAGLPYRDFITVGVLARKLKLRAAGRQLVPDCWIYIQDRRVRLGRLQIFNNWSPYLVRDWRNTVWLGLEYFCSEGDELWNLPEREFIDFAVDELVKIGVMERDDLIDAVRVPVRKAYPAYFGAYGRFGELREFVDGIPNLYCIGRNGQHRYNNMDHSMLCAMEAVKALRGDIPKNAVWEVNTEPEYHEQSQ